MLASQDGKTPREVATEDLDCFFEALALANGDGCEHESSDVTFDATRRDRVAALEKALDEAFEDAD